MLTTAMFGLAAKGGALYIIENGCVQTETTSIMLAGTARTAPDRTRPLALSPFCAHRRIVSGAARGLRLLDLPRWTYYIKQHNVRLLLLCIPPAC